MRLRSHLLPAIIAAALVGGHVGPAAAGPSTADEFTQMFADKNDQTWSGGDQTTSFKAPNGRIYWISADTIVSKGVNPDGSYPATGTTMISNRIMLQNGRRLDNAMADGGLAIPVPRRHSGTEQEKYWPQGAFVASGHLYLLAQRVGTDATPGTLGFKLVGTELAKFSFAPDGKLTFVKMVPTPSTNVPEGLGAAHIQWAADAIGYGRYVYIYGYTDAPPGDPAGMYSYVARVPPAQVEEPRAWRFYRKSSDDWVSSIAQLSSARDNPDAIVHSQISSVREIAGKIVIAHKPWSGFASAVYAEVGSRPQGPFDQVKLFDSPAGTWRGSRYITYGPMLHPEQVLTGAEAGKTLVSINWNGVDLFVDTARNADLYKPRFFAVRLP